MKSSDRKSEPSRSTPPLFVERLLIEAEEPSGAPIRVRYDETRAMTLSSSGTPLVELEPTGGTHTLTEVQAEQEDRDEDPTTFTFVESEGHDRTTGDASDDGWFFVAGPNETTATVTKAMAEVDDADDEVYQSAHLGTKTSVDGEADDFHAVPSTATITRVVQEHDDRDD